MTLAANDVPSLSLLLSGAEAATSIEVSPKERVAAAYIVADRNSGLPKALIAPPPGAQEIVDDLVLLNGGASAPYYSAEGAFRSPDVTAAIRFKDARKPGPGELLAPVAPDIYPLVEATQKAGAVVVIAGPGCFNSENFLDTLETLNNQVGVDSLSLLLLGGGQDIPQNVLHACDATFGGRYSVAGQGPVPKGEAVLFLDTCIVFHDRRTLHLLTELLASSAVASTSCVLIGGEEGRKGWAAEVLFGGYAVQRRFGDDERLLPFTDIGWLVRDVYAVAAPSPLFWVARRADLDLARMMSAPHDGDDRLACLRRGDDQFHVCTTLLSATLTSPEGKAQLSVVREAPAIAGTRFSILRG